MRQRVLRALVISLGVLAAPGIAQAQETGKVYRIGHLSLMPLDAMAPYVGALEQGLRDLGYVHGRNIVIEHRSADGQADRIPRLAAELVRLNPDVVVTGMDGGVVALKQATTTIAIVMIYGTDPVGQKFIASLRWPGGNVTGGTYDPTTAIYGKRLQLLKDIVPGLRRLAFLWNPGFPGAVTALKATEAHAKDMGIAVQSVEVRTAEELPGAFTSIAKARAQSVIVFGEPMTFTNRAQIATLSIQHQLPVMAGTRDFADAGNLVAYGPNLLERWRAAAVYVDKILKGAKPSELPVEQPTRFELVVNLKTAKALGLTMPASLLLRADQVLGP